MKVTLLGYMGSGKSTIGKHLAKNLGVDFIDLDELIESELNQSIPEIFKLKGELSFRKIEKQKLQEHYIHRQNYVLSLGGGTPIFYNNMKLVNENSTSIYLRANPLVLAERLMPEKDNRPLIKHLKSKESLQEFIAKHLFERSYFYEQANFTLDVGAKSKAEIISELKERLNT